MSRPVPFCWYDLMTSDADGAADFYGKVVGWKLSAPDPQSAMDYRMILRSDGGANGGVQFPHSEAFSFQVATDTQEETDRYWNAIVGNGGAESACGWCKDKWGLNWQITPRVLTEGMSDPDAAVRARVFTAMMTMHKIDHAAIEAAARGDA